MLNTSQILLAITVALMSSFPCLAQEEEGLALSACWWWIPLVLHFVGKLAKSQAKLLELFQPLYVKSDATFSLGWVWFGSFTLLTIGTIATLANPRRPTSRYR